MKHSVLWVGVGVSMALAGCTTPVLRVAEMQEAAPAPDVVSAPASAPALVAEPPRPPVIGVPPMAERRFDPPMVGGAVATDPVARSRRMPVYPKALLEDGAPDGRVIASFYVGVEGRPEDVRIEYASHRLFAQEVSAAVKAWRFDPARDADGRAVRTKMRVPFRFIAAD
ncbi:energy transducer TonB [Variovorax sp. KBW07]|uniref:energy transducer TonB n=1 Tax=Variovorax sp. KBW07 TaxID=2153358 RepID=UPI000F55BA73|nr:energy transducer TonB [Variovorax sp. KBW07]